MYEYIEKIDKKSLIWKDISKLLKSISDPTYVRYPKEVLFLENGNRLDSSAENFRRILTYEKIPHNCLYSIGKLPIEYIIEQISWYEVIAFQTTGISKISQILKQHLLELTDKKTIIQCFNDKPMFYYQPEGVVHDIYVLKSNLGDMKYWKYCKKLHETIYLDNLK